MDHWTMLEPYCLKILVMVSVSRISASMWEYLDNEDFSRRCRVQAVDASSPKNPRRLSLLSIPTTSRPCWAKNAVASELVMITMLTSYSRTIGKLWSLSKNYSLIIFTYFYL